MNPHTENNRNLLRKWLPGLIVGAIVGFGLGYFFKSATSAISAYFSS